MHQGVRSPWPHPAGTAPLPKTKTGFFLTETVRAVPLELFPKLRGTGKEDQGQEEEGAATLVQETHLARHGIKGLPSRQVTQILSCPEVAGGQQPLRCLPVGTWSSRPRGGLSTGR
jgi:hypothetical protein